MAKIGFFWQAADIPVMTRGSIRTQVQVLSLSCKNRSPSSGVVKSGSTGTENRTTHHKTETLYVSSFLKIDCNCVSILPHELSTLYRG